MYTKHTEHTKLFGESKIIKKAYLMVGLFNIQLSNTIEIVIINTLQLKILKLKLEVFIGAEKLAKTGCKSKLNIDVVCKIM